VAEGKPASNAATLVHSRDEPWVRSDEIMVPYGKGAEPFQRLSYIDALANTDPELFRNRIVLIGVTAAGLGDMHTTPVSAGADGMPGVVINAYLLRGLQDGSLIAP
jgi:CHASE2 domain-containing sensor protein